MKQQDWTNQLRQRLADHEAPLPEGLWADIERSLPASTQQQAEPAQQPAPQRRARTVMLRRWAAAAAALALLAGAGWQISQLNDSPATGQAAQQIINAMRGTDSATAPATTQPSSSEHRAAAPRPSRGAAAHEANTENAEATEAIETIDTRGTSDTSDTSETIATTAPTPSDEALPSPALPASWADEPRRTPHRRMALSAHAGNLMASSNDFRQTEPMLMTRSAMGPMANYVNDNDPIYLADYSEQTHHKMPVSVGLSLRYQLDDSWWLSAGVDYTRATTTFTHVLNSSILKTEQRLHYVGVPLQAGYTFWQTPRLMAYASAGAEAQVNVKAEVSEGHVDHDRVQLSLLGSAGLELKLWPQFSLYVQPGVRYYPDNGSRVQNIYKERPWQLDVQLGLRYTLR